MVVHEVQIDIDSREAALIGLVRQLYPEGDANISTNLSLNVADVRIRVDGATQLLIERKTVADLYSSLCDNRFREQRARLVQLRKRKPWINLMYIFEGNVRTFNYGNGRITAQYLEQIQRELAYKYRIHTVFVADTVATLRYVGQVQECFRKYGSPESVLDGITDADGTQVGRKRGIGPREFMRAVLTQISGVSSAKAQLIVERYHNLPNLLHAYQRLQNVRDRERLLSGLRASEEARAFGPKLSAKVYNHIFGVESEAERADDNAGIVDEEAVAAAPVAEPLPEEKKKRKKSPKKQSVIMKRGARMSYGRPALLKGD